MVEGSNAREYSVKLYALVLDPNIRVKGRGSSYTDVSMAIAYSPTLGSISKLNPEGILESASFTRISKGRRMINYPGSDDLRVMEKVTRYTHEHEIPDWIGWIVGLVITLILIEIGERFGVFSYFPSWPLWILVFFPIGYVWENIFGERVFYVSEIMISGKHDNVVSFIREVRNNLGRNPILVLKQRDLKRLEDVLGIDPIGLEMVWDRIIEGDAEIVRGDLA